MKVLIKKFNVEMEIKNSGIELEVRSPNGDTQLGDLVLTKSQIIWCPGRTDRAHGHALDWNRFIELMQGAARR